MSIQSTTLEQILKDKGLKIHTIRKENTIEEATKEMVSLKIGSLLIYENGKVVCMITERDILT